MKLFAFAFLGFMVQAGGQNNDCDTLKKCQEVLKLTPRSSLAHYRMGEIFFRLQKDANECKSSTGWAS
jgi:hypothetical protein